MQTLRAGLLIALATLAAAAPAADAQRPEPRIINGTGVSDGQYPWTVALVWQPGPSDQPGDKRAFCGGTLIDEDVVLTAAHCTIGSKPGEFEVVAGDHDLSSVSAPDLFQVTRISLHPQAEGDDDDVVPRRDVSLLTLSGDATAVGGALIPVGDDADTATPAFDVSGWGLIDPFGEDTEDVMRVATVDNYDDGACDDLYTELLGERVFSSTDQICAIRDPDADTTTETDGDPDTINDDVVDTCNGDSGGPLAKSGGSASDPAGWELVGVTSWGLQCALTVQDPDEVVPGVYARAAGSQLRPFVAPGTDAGGGIDTNLEQPRHISGVPELGSTDGGGAIFCVGNPLTWGGGPDQVEQLIRREVDEGIYETVSFTGIYAFDEGDFGDRFICEVHARRTGAGGYGKAQSAPVQVEDAPVVEPEIVEVPAPFPVEVPVPTPVAVPGPTLIINRPDARDTDTTDPRVRSVRRRCTRQRVCTFTVQANDDATGVKSLAVTLNTVRARSCRRNGRRTTCASWRATALRARPVTGQAGTFRITTRRLTRGSHVLHVRAVDGAGNVQAAPRRVTFRLR